MKHSNAHEHTQFRKSTLRLFQNYFPTSYCRVCICEIHWEKTTTRVWAICVSVCYLRRKMISGNLFTKRYSFARLALWMNAQRAVYRKWTRMQKWNKRARAHATLHQNGRVNEPSVKAQQWKPWLHCLNDWVDTESDWVPFYPLVRFSSGCWQIACEMHDLSFWSVQPILTVNNNVTNSAKHKSLSNPFPANQCFCCCSCCIFLIRLCASSPNPLIRIIVIYVCMNFSSLFSFHSSHVLFFTLDVFFCWCRCCCYRALAEDLLLVRLLFAREHHARSVLSNGKK